MRKISKRTIKLVVTEQGQCEKKQTFFELVYSLLKKNLFWTIAGVIVAIVMPLIVYWISIESKTPLEEHKNNIIKNIEVIKSEIHPEQYLQYAKDHSDVKMICNFQNSILKFIHFYEEGESLPSIEIYKDKDNRNTINSIIVNYIDVLSNRSDAISNSLECVNQLLDYGINNNIPYYIPSKAKIAKIIESANKSKTKITERRQKAVEYFSELIEEYGNDGNAPFDKTVEAFRPIEELKNDEDIYALFDDVLSYFIELNHSYELQLRSYQINE